MSAEKKIGENVYKVSTLLATDAIKLQVRLIKVLGGSLERLPTILSKRREGDEDSSNAAAIAAIGDIFIKADTDEIVSLLRDIVETASVVRKSGAVEQVDFDGEFSGKLELIFPVVVFVLQEQFSSFFTGLLANGALKKALKA